MKKIKCPSCNSEDVGIDKIATFGIVYICSKCLTMFIDIKIDAEPKWYKKDYRLTKEESKNVSL